ncbi:MAG TPA: sigma-70 family RNA polymerase sigma factor [Dyadobacter sp.]|jgi:RNA polymerase sigma factor (sigma-70 family)|nr:sigma-70 family RNA polymerase sigma factor [Dyadobacter sp.]
MKLYSDDPELWNSFKTGNKGAYETLLKRYYAPLFQYATRFTKDREQAEDCLQESFIYLWEHRASLGSPESVRFYLFKTIRNNVFLALKKSSAEIPVPFWMEEEADTESKMIEFETSTYNERKLSHLMEGVPERQREALYLKYFQQLSVDQIAAMMGVNKQTASNFLYRGLNYLREQWYQVSVVLCCLYI